MKRNSIRTAIALQLILLAWGSSSAAQTASPQSAIAQQPPANPPLPLPRDVVPPRPLPRPEPSPEPPTPSRPPLPPLDELLPDAVPDPVPGQDIPPGTIVVERFEIVGSTVFTPEELAELVAPFTNRPLTFSQLLGVRTLITDRYVDAGYLTSGAFIPDDQEISGGEVRIQVVEGTLTEINVSGEGRLNTHYIRSRLRRAAGPPLRIPDLVEALQLLQLDPLIETVSAELSAGIRPGESVINVTVTRESSFALVGIVDNGRSPSVGSFRQRVQLEENNLLGLGDALVLAYINTDGSDEFETRYAIPFNASDGTLRLTYRDASSDVIEPPFDEIDIESNSQLYEVSIRQPLSRSPGEEFAIGLSFTHQSSETSLLGEPFPLSPGAEPDGETRVSALRFSQEWSSRSSQQVLAARSEFGIGLDWFDATTDNGSEPDSNFYTWRGQAQWVRLLAEDSLLIVRANTQLADRPLLALEQFGTGGLGSVRGYRQDSLLTDNGIFASVEVRLPVARINEWDSVVQVVPFFDFGKGWNRSSDPDDDPDPNNLIALGLGLRWEISDRFVATIDFGIPLIEVTDNDRTLQEDGILFTIRTTAF